jgi:nitrite reductase/ring-hydroxylating ferredoxin subunit
VATGAVLAPPAVEPVKTYKLRIEQDQVVVEV